MDLEQLGENQVAPFAQIQGLGKRRVREVQQGGVLRSVHGAKRERGSGRKSAQNQPPFLCGGCEEQADCAGLARNETESTGEII